MSPTDSITRAPGTDANSLLFAESSTPDATRENWRDSFPEIVGRSRPLLSVLETVYKVARSDSSVLIFGESGTGKELIASALHRLSSRSPRRFVALNCSAIPESLLESELFGHEKGAFTGAVSRRAGHFEMAHGGTLFLDEIGDMPMRLQSKLLRVLQEKQFTSVGGTQIKTADVRIVAATNIDLVRAVEAGRFRLDLYYRLNVLPVTLPPLRVRRGDVEDLLGHYLTNANKLHSHNEACFFSPDTIDLLLSYPWPGNVRELQNLIERLVVTSGGGEIRPEDLPEEYRSVSVHSEPNDIPDAPNVAEHPAVKKTTYPRNFGVLPDAGIDLPQYVESLENQLILQALERTNHNKNQAARLLGLNRTTLVERIKKRKIAPLRAPAKEL